MSDANQIRINELARELEIKAKVLIEYLPEIGVTEKKTHSSSLDLEHAEQVRKHFRQLAEAEAAAEAAKTAKAKPAARPASAAPPAAARPAASAPTTAPGATRPTAPPVPGRPAAPAASPAATATTGVPPRPVAAAPSFTGAAPAAKPGAAHSAAPRPAAAARPAAPGAAPAQPGAPARPSQPGAPAAQRPAQPGAPAAVRPAAAAPSAPSGAAPSAQRPSAPLPGQAPRPPARPFHPGQGRPGAPQGMRPAAAGQTHPTGAPRPGAPPRVPPRPGGPRPGQPLGGPRPGSLGAIPKAEPGKPLYARKPPTPQRGRPTIEKRFAEGERRLHPVRTRAAGPGRATQAEPTAPVRREPREVTVTEGITVRELAEKLDVRAKDLLKVLLDRGIFASINQPLDVPTATSLAEAFSGIVQVVTFEEQLVQEEKVREERTGNLQPRAPVVTVMGHVDHGKTSLLDAIRETEVAVGEAGGITQHIGAYEARADGRRIVFIDTPGHEAFTRMRARGAKVTDVVVLVVAADDGVMPQTEEAIDHARAAKVPIIVAINKIDKAEAQPERIKQQLSDRGLLPEDWGGDTVMVPVSARTHEGLDTLLEMILLVTDLADLKANPGRPAMGNVIEAQLDRGRGPVATVLVRNGTLSVGDFFICGAVFGKVRAMLSDRGEQVREAEPATPVEVLGLDSLPEAGDDFQVVTDTAK